MIITRSIKGELHRMSEWRLTKKDYDILLSYIGCGNFPDADIIVYGNEEGTGGYSVEANVKARVNLFGKDPKGKDYLYCIKNNDPVHGFYEPSGREGGKKVEQYIKHNEKIQEDGFTAGSFNQAIARICLTLEDNKKNNWFESAEENTFAWETIKNYIVNELYKPRIGIQTALADWRPLPRENEKVWPSEYSSIAKSKKNNYYLSTFDKPKSKKIFRNDFSDFKKDMQKRMNILKYLFEMSKCKVIIGIGGVNGFKKESLELMFGENIFKDLTIESADMFNKKGQRLSALTATVPLENKTLHIYLIPFPEAGNIFKTQKDALKMLNELTTRYIIPAMKA
jgi:hypothetical protein